MTPQQLKALQSEAQQHGITAAQARDYGPISDPATWAKAIEDAKNLAESYQKSLETLSNNVEIPETI